MRTALPGFLLALSLGLAAPAWAQGGEPATTRDPAIPVEQLEVLVKPLTKPELEPEVEAWQDLVREKAGAIAEARLSVQKTQQALVEAEEDPAAAARDIEAAENAERGSAQGVDAPEGGAGAPAGAPDGGIEARAEQTKDDALENLAALQKEQTALIERLRVVLDSYQRKGGEVDEISSYLAALQQVQVDPSGVEATWAAVKGWLVSEEGGVRLAKRLAAFLAILVATWILARGVTSVTHRWLEGSQRLSELAKGIIERSVGNVVMATGLVVAVASLGVAVGPLLAAVGAAGFIVGFALQGTLSNFASGLMILVYRPFDVGDVVEAGGIAGKVAEMNLVSTTFNTFDNQRIIVPNNEIWGNVITNVTANELRRVDLVFGVAYDADLDQVEKIIQQAVEEHELVVEEPEPVVKVHELADSAVMFVCRPWTRTENYWNVHWDLTRAMKHRFDAAGISIPFPQREIHVHQEAMVDVSSSQAPRPT